MLINMVSAIPKIHHVQLPIVCNVLQIKFVTFVKKVISQTMKVNVLIIHLKIVILDIFQIITQIASWFTKLIIQLLVMILIAKPVIVIHLIIVLLAIVLIQLLKEELVSKVLQQLLLVILITVFHVILIMLLNVRNV